MALPGPEFCWHCQHHIEWVTIEQCWDNSGVTHTNIPDATMTLICVVSGIGYESERHLILMAALGIVKTETGLPPPLDIVWFAGNDWWWHLGAIYDGVGDPDWDECEFFLFPGAQGAGWPVRWPAG